MKGYEKLGKYLAAKGMIISVLISLLMIYFSNQISWTLEFISVFKEGGVQLSFLDIYCNLFDIMREVEILSGETNIVSSFYGDLIMGYFLSAIVIIANIKNLFFSDSVKELTKLD